MQSDPRRTVAGAYGRADMFLNRENAEFLRSKMAQRGPPPSMSEMQRAMLQVAAETASTTRAMPPQERVQRLNEYMFNTFVRKLERERAPPKPKESGAPKVYRDDERVVVLNTRDRDWANTQPSPYDFVVRLNADPKQPGISLDDSIKQCTTLEPLALFVPRGSDAVDRSAFVVLETDIDSSNTVTSSERRLNGTNVVMCRNEDHGSTRFERYANLTNTRLQSNRPMQKLSSIHLRVLLPTGDAVEAQGVADGGITHRDATATLRYRPGDGDWYFNFPDGQAFYGAATGFEFDYVAAGRRYALDDLSAAAAAGDPDLAAALAATVPANGSVAAERVRAAGADSSYQEHPLDWLSLRPVNATEPHLVLRAYSRVREANRAGAE